MRSPGLLALVASLCLVASARADGPTGLMLIGRGASGDVHWTQRARANGTRVTTELTLREADNASAGGFSDARLSASDPVDWTPYHDVGSSEQQLLAGAVYSTVGHLRVVFADGTTRQISLKAAPSGARGKWPALQRFRFFVVPLAQRPAMQRLVAIDRRGKVIVRIRLPPPA